MENKTEAVIGTVIILAIVIVLEVVAIVVKAIAIAIGTVIALIIMMIIVISITILLAITAVTKVRVVTIAIFTDSCGISCGSTQDRLGCWFGFQSFQCQKMGLQVVGGKFN